jgi:hypothetical protein
VTAAPVATCSTLTLYTVPRAAGHRRRARHRRRPRLHARRRRGPRPHCPGRPGAVKRH